MDLVLVGIIVYLIAQLALGVFVSRWNTTEDDYLLAGRSLGYGLATVSLFATWFGAETCIGAAGRVHEEGLAGATHDPLGYAACLLLMGLVFAVPLYRRQLTTLADLFRQRYSVGVERAAVLLMVPTSVLWAAAQINAFGQVLSASSEFGVSFGITVAAVVVIVYTCFGGMMADVATDFIQGICLVIGLIIVGWAAITHLGGFEAAIASVEAKHWNLFSMGERTPLELAEEWSVPILGSVVAQELISRILACRDERVAQRGTLIAGGIYLLVGSIPVTVGILGASLGANVEQSEQILPTVARMHLSTWAYVLFAGALVSAILSTVNSALLVSASLVSHNVFVPLYPRLSEMAKVRLARGGVIIFGIVAYVLALYARSVYELVEDASSFGSAGILVIMTFGLFTRFGGPASAYCCLASGTTAWLIGEHYYESDTPYLISLGTAVTCYVTIATFSRLWSRRSCSGLMGAAGPEVIGAG